MTKYTTKSEEHAYYEQERETNLRYIRAKIAHAPARELALIAAFIDGIGIIGWSEAEYHRPIQKES